ncbi:hypothetical protein BJX66DRAFT_346926 [Aspergillus keveii]|uniref:LysM domain-containing protein n=1 Tax=Aspergillus keveii TaxID=714993 RepID=A0ABR4FTF9_9EURO
MHLIHLLVAGLVPWLGFFALSHRAVNCLFATTPGNGTTCESLHELNPGITCPNLYPSGLSCVIGTVIDDPTGTTLTTTTSTATSTRTTTTSNHNRSHRPTPTMPGIADHCDGFYKISSGYQCSSIAQKHGVTIAQLRSWNSEINAECSNLWRDYYICVHVPGVATSTSTTITTTTTAPGTGPTPQQSGIISRCNKYHLVESGDGCASIASTYGISLANFYNWNPAVGSSCGSLWLGLPSQSTTTTTTTTKTTTTATTTTEPGPSATQSGLVKTCTSFYKAAAGDTCDQKYSITTAQFNRWNLMVGSSCTSLWESYFVCIGV